MTSDPDPSSALRIERLSRADATAYRELMLEAYALAPGAWISTVEERARLSIDWWEDRVDSRSGTSIALGAFVEDALVGMTGIRFSEPSKTRHKAVLFGMYVAPPHRGYGLGKQLVNASLEHTRSHDGITVVQLSLIEGNPSAAALYVSCGFATFAVEPCAIHADGGYRSITHMWLDLSGNQADSRV